MLTLFIIEVKNNHHYDSNKLNFSCTNFSFKDLKYNILQAQYSIKTIMVIIIFYFKIVFMPPNVKRYIKSYNTSS